jgi:4-hydroxy-2-oxoheptanedioate aldolase
MRPNHVKRAWKDGKQTIGGWIGCDSVYVAEMMARAGFDWLCIDMQHGLLDYNDVRAMLPAISTTPTMPIVRVPWNEPHIIMKALDAGAYGVIVPLVNNREEAEKAVSACRYPPDGGRSFGPIRAGMYGGRGYVDHANEEIACIAMIETAEALANLDDICSTPGLDAVYIGPSDLAYAIGLQAAGDNSDPKHVETVNHVYATARKHGISVGIHTGSLEYTKRYLDQGFDLVMLGSDTAFMARLANQELRAARTDTGTERVPPGDDY